MRRGITGLLIVAVTGLVTNEYMAMRHAQAPRLHPVAHISELMHAMIEPSANALFEAVAVTVDQTGESVRAPDGEAEWMQLRREALVLAEAANLLQVAGRPLGRSRSNTSPAASVLSDRQRQRMIDLDRRRWSAYAAALGRAAGWALEAIDERSPLRLHAAGGDLSFACERCHLAYRHAGTRIPAELEP